MGRNPSKPNRTHRTLHRPLIATLATGIALLALPPASPASSARCGNEIRGTDAGEALRGTGSGDRIVGRGGRDLLVGRGGADCLRGGGGNDVLRARDGSRDVVRCGAGVDRARLDRHDVARRCEQTQPKRSARPPRCADGKDNDGDGRVDYTPDPGCVSASDNDETNSAPPPPPPPPPPACGDSVDNDTDGKIDYPADPGCSSATDGDEADPPPPAPPPAECAIDAATMTAPGCTVLHQDTAAVADPTAGLWGTIDCQTSSRHQRPTSGGDGHVTASGASQGDSAYRRLTALDGDDYYGERCELGRNEHRYGENAGTQTSGTFALYRQGQHKITFFSERYPSGFLPGVAAWQTVMQMKQTQPYSSDGNVGVALELQLWGGQLRLHQRWSSKWTTPAPVGGSWIRYALDVVYSTDPAVGSVKVYVDRNGDGDWLDGGEQSPLLQMATLVTETTSGQAIPDHLRIGIYHNPSISCPSPSGCAVEVDNVQVLSG